MYQQFLQYTRESFNIPGHILIYQEILYVM